MTRSSTPPLPYVPGLSAPDDPPSKRQVLSAALELFVERGYAETSVRDIGERAGYSNPVIFKYFADKNELATHVFLACYRSVAELLAPAVRDGRDYRANVRALCEAFDTILNEQLAAFLFVTENVRRFWPRTSPALRRLSLLSLAKRLIEQGRGEGVVARDANVAVLVAGFAGLFSQVARMRYFGSFDDRADDLPRALERVLIAMGQ